MRRAPFLLIALLLAQTGCNNPPLREPVRGGLDKLTDGGKEVRVNISPSQAQSALVTQCDNVWMHVADATGKVLRRPESKTDAKLYVMAKRLAITSAILTIGSDPNPLVGYIDLYTLVVLQGRAFDGQASREVLDDVDRQTMVESLGKARDELRRSLLTTLTEPQLASVDEMIDAWIERHPDQEAVSYVRLTEFSVERQINPESARRGELPRNLYGLLLLDPLSGLDPTVREIEQTRLTAERNLYWVKRLPTVLSWQVELTSVRLLNDPQLDRALKSAEQVSGSVERALDSTGQLVNVAQRVARSAESVAGTANNAIGDAGEQGRKLLEQVDRIVDARLAELLDRLFQLIARERRDAQKDVNQLVAHRTEELMRSLTRDLSVERQRAIEQATASIAEQREAALNQVAELVAKERESTLRDVESVQQDLRGLLDRAAALAVAVIAFAAIATTATVWAVRRARAADDVATK
jgi:hypothetical protein